MNIQNYQHYVPNSIAAKLVCIDERFTKPTKSFTGKQCIKEFPEWVFEKYDKCKQIISKYFKKKLIVSREDEERYKNTQNCWICNKQIVGNKNKVRGHCHITGKFRSCT